MLQDQNCIFLKQYITTDNVEDFRYVDATVQENIVTVLNQEEIDDTGILNYSEDSIFYYIDKNIFKTYNRDTEEYTLNVGYRAIPRKVEKIKFQYVHSADEISRIDPSSSNINRCLYVN